MSVAIYSRDLMGISTIDGAAKAAGQTTVSVADIGDFVARVPADVQWIFVDLGAVTGSLAEFTNALRSHAPYAKIVAHGPHVHENLLAEASAAGCDKVMTRGQFMRSLPVLFGTGSV